MPSTARIHGRAADLLDECGLHTGEQFIGIDGALDVPTAYYLTAENIPYADAPAAFRADEDAAALLISCSAPTMQALRELAETLDVPQRVTPTCPGHEVPDWLDTVANWPSETIAGRRPTTEQVIAHIRSLATIPAAA